MTPSASDSNHRRLLTGVGIGVLLTMSVRYAVDNTPAADWLAAPLFVSDTGGSADAIVALGAATTALCTPNHAGTQRVLLASRLFHERRAPLVVFSGGFDDEGGCSVAETMLELAVRLGVPRDRIRIEAGSASTWENAEHSDLILKAIGAERVLLVTDRPHMRRAEATFRRFGYGIERASVPVPFSYENNSSLLKLVLREYAAWAYYWARGYVGSGPAARALVPALPADPIREEGGDSAEMPMNDATRRPHERSLVVIHGASYAGGWRPPDVDGLRFVTTGISGNQSFEMRERFERDVLARNPGAVVIWGFVNDIARAPRAEIEPALARVRQSYIDMVQLSRRAGIEPILATEVTIRQKREWRDELATFVGGFLGRRGYPDYVNGHVKATNAWLRELALREGLLLLDFEQVLSGPSGRRRRVYAQADGSHLSEAGYARLTRYAGPLLSRHLTSSSP